jgi:hypothetical protein
VQDAGIGPPDRGKGEPHDDATGRQGHVFGPALLVAKAHVDAEHYDKMYAASVSDPDTFWGEHGLRIDWIKPYTKVKNTSFEFGKVDIKWFEDGTLNVSANCIDRHMISRADQTAIIWEPDDPKTPPSTSPMPAAGSKPAAWPTC